MRSNETIPWHPDKWRGFANIEVRREHPELCGNIDEVAHLQTLIGQRATQMAGAAKRGEEVLAGDIEATVARISKRLGLDLDSEETYSEEEA